MKKDYIQNIDENAERRFFNPQIEVREDGDDLTIEGVAAVINRTTDLGWYKERIAKGAFDDVMKDDVVALFNHDPNYPLARTGAKGDSKLDLFLDNEGNLAYRFKAPNTSIGKDMMENIRTGIVSKSSFAFTIKEDEWERGKETDIRTIKKIKRLYDVSPVTYPAYSDTSVAARSAEIAQQPEKDYAKDLAERDKDLRELF